MTAEDVIAALKTAYASCHTYADTGCVRTVFLNPDGSTKFVSTKPFETAFVRPDRFRFEFSSHHPGLTEYSRYIIAVNGPDVRKWWDISPGVERPESLALALAGATGVSGGSAHTVPALLLPETERARLGERAAPSLMADAEWDGVPCYRIQLREVADPERERQFREEMLRIRGWCPPPSEREAEVVWIDRVTFLLRRIESSTRFSDFRTECVTSYEPTFDEPIPDEHLEFDPPAE